MMSSVVAGFRGMFGVLLLTDHAADVELLGVPDVSRPHPIVKLLGARHLLEAAVLASHPTRRTVKVAVGVDTLHVLSCLGFACVSRSHRRSALRDAAFESGLLLATWLSRPRVAPRAGGDRPQLDVVRTDLVPARPHLVRSAGGSAPAGSTHSQGLDDVIVLPVDTPIALGRGKRASSQDAQITCQSDGTTVLRDLGGEGDIRVNGIPVSTAELHDGDRIDVGATSFAYRGSRAG